MTLFAFCFSLYAQEVEIQSSGQIKNVKDPVDPQDAVTKAYVDNIVISYFNSLPNGLQTLLDAGECPLNLVDAGVSKDSLIGKMYQGGLIYYLDDLDTVPGMKGLVSAPSDAPTVLSWGNSGGLGVGCNDFTTGATFKGVGDGTTNTVTVLNAACDSTGSAFDYVDTLSLNGYADWFLPSNDELNEIYLKIGQGAPAPNSNIGNFSNSFYWSSSEHNGLNARAHSFNDGFSNIVGKSVSVQVRAVRAF